MPKALRIDQTAESGKNGAFPPIKTAECSDSGFEGLLFLFDQFIVCLQTISMKQETVFGILIKA